MNLMFAIHTCQKADRIAQALWNQSWYPAISRARESSAVVPVFIGPRDRPFWVPSEAAKWVSGYDRYVLCTGTPENQWTSGTDENLPRRILDTLWGFLDSSCDRLLMIEYDVFLADIPTNLPEEFAGTWFEDQFVHSPWCMGRETALAILRDGQRCLMQGINAGGWPDRFLAKTVNRLGMPVSHTGNYSQNTLDESGIAKGREALRRGGWAVHGVKTLDTLKKLTQ